jgi:hypothetical protein
VRLHEASELEQMLLQGEPRDAPACTAAATAAITKTDSAASAARPCTRIWDSSVRGGVVGPTLTTPHTEHNGAAQLVAVQRAQAGLLLHVCRERRRAREAPALARCRHVEAAR